MDRLAVLADVRAADSVVLDLEKCQYLRICANEVIQNMQDMLIRPSAAS